VSSELDTTEDENLNKASKFAIVGSTAVKAAAPFVATVATVPNVKTSNLLADVGKGALSALQTAAPDVETVKSLSGLANGASSAVKALTPILAPLLVATGIGIPLAGALFLASNLAKMAGDNIELQNMFGDITLILKKCYLLNNLINKTMITFIQEFKKQPQNTTFSIDKDLETRIENKIESITKLLIKIAPQETIDEYKKVLDNQVNENGKTYNYTSKESSMYSRYKQKFNNFIKSASYKELIIRELVILNSLFIIYNSNFDWSIQLYERKLATEQVKEIWKTIEQTPDFKEYLNPPDNLIELVVTDLKPQSQEAKNKELIFVNEIDISIPTGGSKSKKRKPRHKHKKTRKY